VREWWKGGEENERKVKWEGGRQNEEVRGEEEWRGREEDSNRGRRVKQGKRKRVGSTISLTVYLHLQQDGRAARLT